MVISMGVRADQTDGGKIVYLGREDLGFTLEYITQLLYLPGKATRIVEFTAGQLLIEDDRRPWTPLNESIPIDSKLFTYSFTPAPKEWGRGSFEAILVAVAGHIVRKPGLVKSEEAREAALELVRSLK